MRKKGPGAAEAHPTINIFPSTDALLCVQPSVLGKKKLKEECVFLESVPSHLLSGRLSDGVCCIIYLIFCYSDEKLSFYI